MSNQSTAWAQRCKVGSPVAKSVLLYLADCSHDDGTCAYPRVTQIMAVTEYGERSVRAALKLLEERGYIRRGDQRHSALVKGGGIRKKQYRQVVWDLCVEKDPSVLAYVRATHIEPADSVEQPAAGSSSADSRPAPHAGLENTDAGSRPCTTCTSRPAPHAPHIEPSSYNHYPSAPTGHLPVNGEHPVQNQNPGDDGEPDDDAWHIAESGPRVERNLPAAEESVFAAMQYGLEARPWMPVPKAILRPGQRDRRAVQRLNGRFGAIAVARVAQWAMMPPTTKSESVSNGKPYDGFWRKTITSSRALEANWDKIIAQMADDRHGRALLAALAQTSRGDGPTEASPAPNPGVTHVPRPCPASSAETEATRMARRAELAEYAAAHGSTSCFAGNWQGGGDA